jgi:hypothetical protein
MTLPCPTNIGNPTPGTDAISLLDIQNEFDDGSAKIPIAITEYYRDGSTGYVVTNSEGTTDNIPTGPIGNQISFANFFCMNGEVVIHINKNTLNPDISLLFGKYWKLLRPKRLIVDNGIYVYNTNPYKTSRFDGYAMRVWDTLLGQLTIENYGFIQGAGGRYGGNSIIAGESRTDANVGGQGGNAIYIGPTALLAKFNRYFNGSKHYYGETPPTTGYNVEASDYFRVYSSQASGTSTLYRLSNPVTGAQLLALGSEYTSATNSTESKFVPAGTTTVTGLNYIPGYISVVYVNSSVRTDYTANDGTSITFFSPLTAFGGALPNSAIVQIVKSKPWTGEGEVGYVYSSPAPNYIPIYRSYKGPSNPLATDFLLSTSSTEGPNAGYTSQGIAFYAPTSAAANPKPTIYIKNYGQIAAGGGGGGKGGDGGSASFSLAGGYFTGTITNRATVGGLGQGYGQVNTSSDKNLVSSAQNVKITTSSTDVSINIPSGSDSIQVSTSGGGITLFIASNTSSISASTSGGGITAFISPYVTNVNLSSSGGGINVYVSSNTSNIRASTSGGGVNVTGAGAAGVSASSSGGGVTKDNNGQNYPQNITNLSAYFNGEVYDTPSVSGAAGAGGDGGTFGNPGGNGQNGSTSNGSPGGPAGVAIYGISYVVGGVTGNAVLGSTTE